MCIRDRYQRRVHGKNASYFKVEITQPGIYYFTINQQSKRCYPRDSAYNYSVAKILLAKVQGSQYILVKGVQKKDKETWVTDYLNQGSYILYTKCAWNNKAVNQIVLSSYGPSNVKFTNIKKNQIGGNEFLEQVFRNYLIQNPDQLQPFQHDTKVLKAINCSPTSGFGYIFIQNTCLLYTSPSPRDQA
eukprot:TRINITY_DN1249_c0_g1_i1.p2 TRINITY_DN1249_c0_g1~~TRINITY_DN1249_c0_g1_i1.p2  ORF type:complete len:188 (+),score=36.79 TRINITY_DN1249_c0_g1_i1:129-692(+)